MRNRIRFSGAEKFIFAALICLALGGWLVRGQIWFGVDSQTISINGRSLSEGSDYSVFRSLSGDIFCYSQDHGAQYLISPARNEVSVISERERVTILPDFFLFSHRALAGVADSNRQRLPGTQLTISSGLIEFVGVYNERWRISN